MDAFKAQLDRVREQLAGLTGSQRMLVAALVAVMALTLMYWGRYAGSPEMTPVLDQSLTDEQVGQIDHELDAAHVPHGLVAGKVMVPAERRSEALADLMYAKALPADTHSAFEEMSAKSLTWFSSPSERDTAYTQATAQELAAFIRRWPGVTDARVMINAKNDRRIGVEIPPTATVDVHTGGSADKAAVKQLVQAAADGVAGAVSGLTPANIKVIVDGHSVRVATAGPDGQNWDVPSFVELKEQAEGALEQKIHGQFYSIPNLAVGVICDVDNQSKVSDIHTFNKAGAFVQPLVEHTQSGQAVTTEGGSREPGAATNDGTNGPAAVDGGAVSGPATTSNTSTSDEKNENAAYVPDEVTHVVTPAGKPVVQSVSVSIPRSDVAREFHAAHPSVKDPSDADLAAAETAEVARVRQKVAGMVGLAVTSDRVTVDTFADDVPATDLTMAAAAGPAVATTSALLGGHAKDIGMAALAAVSLAMVFQVARRSNAAVMPMSNPSLAGLNLGLNGTDYDGDDGEDDARGPARNTPAEVASAALLIDGMEGMELDAETLRTQQMLDQVSTLVQEDPDAAAALVKRWVTRA